MTPPLSKRAGIAKFLDREVDFGKTYRGLPIFGSHKTWRGVILGILVGMLIVWLQRYLYQFSLFKNISLFNYNQINVFLFGFLISFGAIIGDLLFSFLKRRLKKKPGESWVPFDQTDYVVGVFLILTPFLKLGLLIWFTIIVITFFLHIIFNRLGYELKINDSKW